MVASPQALEPCPKHLAPNPSPSQFRASRLLLPISCLLVAIGIGHMAWLVCKALAGIQP